MLSLSACFLANLYTAYQRSISQWDLRKYHMYYWKVWYNFTKIEK